MRILLLEERANFLELTSPCTCIVEKVAQFGRVGLDLLHILLVLRVTFEDKHLVLWAALLARAMERMKQGAHGDGWIGKEGYAPSTAGRMAMVSVVTSSSTW
jgi:hypothetical protein